MRKLLVTLLDLVIVIHQGKYQDSERDTALNKLGITVLRYSNADINIRFDAVMKDLYHNIHSRL